MKLKRITLNNFRSHSETSLDLSPGVTLVTGPVGAGKTSIVAGIAACLTGRNAMTDGRGIGLDQQIMDGTDRLALSLEFDDGIRLTRTRERGGTGQLLTNLPGMAGQKSQAMQMALMMRLGISEETLLALLDTRPFASLEKATQKNILLALARPQALALDGAMLRAASELLSREVRPESLEEVRALYSEIYSLRTVLNRQKAALPSPAKPDMTDVPSLAKVQADYRAAIQQNQVLTAEVSRLEQSVANAKSQADATNEFATAEDLAAAEQKATEARLSAEAPTKACLDAGHAYQECRLKRGNPTPEQEAVLAVLEKLKPVEGLAAREDFERSDILARTVEEPCPTCGKPRRILSKQHQVALANVEARIEKRRIEREQLAEELRLAEEAANNAHEARLAELKQVLDDATVAANAAVEVVKAADREVARIKKERKAAEKLDALREQTATDETRLPLAREELLACQRKIARIEEVQTEVQRLTDQQKAWENASAQHQRLAGQIASCETLVEYFGPSGVQAAQLSGGDFEEGVSKLLEQAGMPGRFELKNSSAKTGDIALTVAGRPVQNLSEGEQFLFEFAFRAAAALRSGFPVVCLDGANRLNGKRMRALVRAATASGVQIIVTTLEVPTEMPQGVEIVLVSNPNGVSIVGTATRTISYAEASN